MMASWTSSAAGNGRHASGSSSAGDTAAPWALRPAPTWLKLVRAATHSRRMRSSLCEAVTCSTSTAVARCHSGMPQAGRRPAVVNAAMSRTPRASVLGLPAELGLPAHLGGRQLHVR